MDALASTSSPQAAAHYTEMAARWRQLARQAAWQDGFPHLDDES